MCVDQGDPVSSSVNFRGRRESKGGHQQDKQEEQAGNRDDRRVKSAASAHGLDGDRSRVKVVFIVVAVGALAPPAQQRSYHPADDDAG